MDEFVPEACLKEIDEGFREFKVVFIPCDISKDICEERVVQTPGRGLSAMLDFAKDRFRQAKLQGEHLEKYQADLLKEHKTLPVEALGQMSDMTLCEVVPLLGNTKRSLCCALNLVVDDKAKSKNLPANVRATSIAGRCGLDQIQVLGDAFLCRQFDNEDGFYRLDFGLQDLANDLWVNTLCKASRNEQLGVQAARQFKDAGNELFRTQQYQLAAAHYRQAVALLPSKDTADAVELRAQCLSNLSACRLKLGRADLALKEADACLQAKPQWNKAWGRRADALKALGNRQEEAKAAYARAGLAEQ